MQCYKNIKYLIYKNQIPNINVINVYNIFKNYANINIKQVYINHKQKCYLKI